MTRVPPSFRGSVMYEIDAMPDIRLQLCIQHIERDEYPMAIGYAESGLRANPADRELAEARTIARSLIEWPTDPVAADRLRPESSWYPNALFSVWFLLAGYLAFALMCVAVTRWWQVRRRGWLWLALLWLPLALVPPANQLVQFARFRTQQVRPFRVVNRDCDLRTGNGAEYPVVAHLPRGVECRESGERGGWLRVEFASGMTGWIPAAAIDTVVWSDRRRGVMP